MIFKHFTLFLICFSALSFATTTELHPNEQSRVPNKNPLIITQEAILYDKARNRLIPIMVYKNSKAPLSVRSGAIKIPVVLINHGYSVKNTEYSFLAKALAAQGYFVVSIQHDLKTDTPLPVTGNLFVQRKPLWARGVANILFVMKSLPKMSPHLDLTKMTLIGHSHGGDIVLLFLQKHPHWVKQAISLDSLRMPFPRTGSIPILSLRAKDTQADKGVLPPVKIHKNLNTSIILLNAQHIDLCDRGSLNVREEINRYILNFLQATK